jgi:transposase-like protein
VVWPSIDLAQTSASAASEDSRYIWPAEARRRAVELVTVHGATYAEATAAVGCPRPTLRDWLRKARAESRGAAAHA